MMKKEGMTSGDSPTRPIVIGADVELGNFVAGLESDDGTGALASRLLLEQIEGFPLRVESSTLRDCECDVCRARRESESRERSQRRVSRPRGTARVNPQDWGRRYLASNGGCAYIDLDHLELCTPEVRSAYEYVAAWHAMLRIARQALESANESMPDGSRVKALVNNSDGSGNSYGSHLNFMVSRRTWENLFNRRMHYLLYLASYQASSIVFTGQGKVGSENGRRPVDFQLSQRADFFETLTGHQTTYRRPLVNSRDEPLCGRAAALKLGDDEPARLHVIFYDSTLCHTASLLKAGVMQLVLAMIECERVDASLILEDPLDAVLRWSHDPSLTARARLVDGREVTAIELQEAFLCGAQRLIESGEDEGRVPRAVEIADLWEDTLVKLGEGDLAVLARRIDWALKLAMLRQVLESRPDLDWSSPQIKHLDHLYSGLDPEEGLYWAYERSGLVETLVPDSVIEHFTSSPPDDTRAWTRAMLLRAADGDAVENVNWDAIRFRIPRGRFGSRSATVELADPAGHTRQVNEQSFRAAGDLEELLEALGARSEEPVRSSRRAVRRRVVRSAGPVN